MILRTGYMCTGLAKAPFRRSISAFQWLLQQRVRHNSSSHTRWLKRQSKDYYTREAKVRDLRSRAAFKLMEIDDKFHLFSKNKAQRVLDLGFAPGAWSQIAKERAGTNSTVLGVDILPCEPPTGVSSIQANILSKRTHDLIRLYFYKHLKLNHHDELHEDIGYFHHDLEQTAQDDFDTYREVLSTDTPSGDDSKISKLPIDVVISDMYEPWLQTSGFWNNLTNSAYYRMANTSGLAIRDHYQSIDLCDAALVTAIDLLKPMGSFVCKLYTGKEDKLFEKRLKKVFKRVSRFKPDASRDESKEIYFVGLGKRENVDKIGVFIE